jgi:hypothetical protein
MLTAIARVPGSAYPRARRASGDPVLAEFHRTPSMKPVSVQVIAYAPTVFTHCQHCELAFQEMGIGQRVRRQQTEDALPRDLALEFQSVSDWVHDLLSRHGPNVRVDVLDAASIRGVISAIRHGIWRYPAVIVDGRTTSIGTDFGVADAVIDWRIAEGLPPTPGSWDPPGRTPSHRTEISKPAARGASSPVGADRR